MKAKLIVEGNEFDIEILDPKLQKLIMPPKKTGYEKTDGQWYYVDMVGGVNMVSSSCMTGEQCYDLANYYSDKTVAENNARADKLMRQLRRFAVEHRVNNLNWDSDTQAKWMIEHNSDGLGMYESNNIRSCGTIYFDRLIDAEAAIEKFRDELVWYFTEYEDSL